MLADRHRQEDDRRVQRVLRDRPGIDRLDDLDGGDDARLVEHPLHRRERLRRALAVRYGSEQLDAGVLPGRRARHQIGEHQHQPSRRVVAMPDVDTARAGGSRLDPLDQIPEKGIGYGILKYITPTDLKEVVKFNNEPQIAFNYLGQFDSDVKQMSQFRIAKESRGQEVSSRRENNYDFLFGGMIAGGRLSITVRFKKKYYSEELISDLLDNYRNSLIDIINHCINASVPKNKSLIDNVVVENEAGEYTDEVMI